MDPEKHIEGERFPIASLSHYESKSNLLSLLPSNRPQSLVLYNDGILEIDQKNSLMSEDAFRVLNVRDVNAVLFRGGRYTNRLVYSTLNLFSIFSAFICLIMVETWMHTALWGLPISDFQIVSFGALFVPILFDVYREKLATPEVIEFTSADGESKFITGDLPNEDIHNFAILLLFLTMVLAMLITAIWIEENAAVIGDLLVGIFATTFVILLAKSLVKKSIDNSKESVTGVSSSNIPNGLTHMYFAAMSIRSSEGIGESNQDINSKELDDIRERLLRHETIISSIVSANDIFQAPSPSLGVLAIRVSTETLMRHACDNIGITWKPNARPTLESYVQRYVSTKQLDSRVRSYLDNIRAMGNRAAHDFNLDWGEFKVSLDQFCEIVSWYSESFDSKHESE